MCSDAFDDLPDADLKDLYVVQRLSCSEIGRRYGTYGDPVSKRLASIGIALRPRKSGTCRIDEATLRRLYVDERLTTREIAERFNSSHMSVKRWLRAFGIEARAPGHGLANRGAEPPSAEELRRLVQDELLTYDSIGKRYGVHRTAVMSWLRRHGIKANSCWTTRSKGKNLSLPSAKHLRDMYCLEMLSCRQIAAHFGVGEDMIRSRLSEIGVEFRAPGFGSTFTCTDGHVVRSAYERTVDEWLYRHSVPHLYEPKLPGKGAFRSDFLANEWYIEIWGVVGSELYNERRSRKIARYKAYDLPLIELEPHHFGRGAKGMDKRLRSCLDIASGPFRLF